MSILHNTPLMAAVVAWFLAQLTKVVIHSIRNKQFDIGAFFASGGMPSSHSSTVTALALSIGLQEGVDTPIFAVALIFAIIVMYDATGVRQAVNRHARLLNEFFHMRIKDFKQLNEFVGHTEKEVFVGALLGVVIAILFSM